MKHQPPELAPQAAPRTLDLETAFVAVEPRLGRFVAQLLDDRERAAEILQDTFVAALADRRGLTEVKNVDAWLFGIARNRVLVELRTRRRARVALARLAGLREDGRPDHDASVAIRELLRRALSPEDRVLLVLRYVHGFSAPELARMTGATPEAVRQRLARARKRVLERSEAEGERGGLDGT